MSDAVQWELAGADAKPIYGDTHLPKGEPVGSLVLCHGLKGYKDYGLFPQLAEAAARRGLVAHRFNFSHSGMTRNLDTFERPDLFEHDTWGRQVFDLQAVARAAAGGELPGGAPSGGQVWFGHSRGGVTALLAAGEAFGGEARGTVRPAAVIAASAPHTADRMDDDQKAMLRKAGRIASPSSRTGQTLYVGVDWLHELEADPDRYNLTRQVERIRCPILLIHGDNDGTVNLMSARLLKAASADRAGLHVIAGGTHTFNAPNPLPLNEPPPPQTRQLIDAACDFALNPHAD